MGLQFVFGSSGFGKSRYVYEMAIRESSAFPDKNFIVLVPEQFTVQAEKDLCALHPAGGILNIQVLSFGRLAYRVFEEVGAPRRSMLDDEGKNLIIRKIAGKYENELTILKGNLKKQGYVSEVKAVISEFKQYGIGLKELDRFLEGQDKESYLYYKLKDVRKVYEGFEKFLSDKYITNEDVLDVLSQVISGSKFLKGSIVIMDGFTGFTPVQDRILEEMLMVCGKIVLTVLMDKREDPYVYKSPYQLFALSKQTVSQLLKMAGRQRVKIEEAVWLTDKSASRFAHNEALGFLESELFRYSQRQFNAPQDSIRIYVSRDPKRETEFVASQIQYLVRVKKMRYRQIGIIAADMEAYGAHLEKSLKSFGIPVFMDYKKSILHNAFAEYIRSLLSMAEQGFSYESVFRFLRTGMSGFTGEEVDSLENYVLATGLRGFKRWQEEWKTETKEAGEDELAYLNGIRARFAENVGDLISVLTQRSKTVKDVTFAVYTFLVKGKCQQRIADMEAGFSEKENFVMAKEYSQIYRIVIELFDKLVELLGDERISLKDYCELFDAGLEEAKVGVIPPSLDTVMVGDVQRTRFVEIKALFLVGANDVYLPGNLGTGGLLSEQDKERFMEEELRLSPGIKEKAYIQKLYLYMKLSKPTDYLCVSYSKASAAGKSVRQSYLVNELKRLFPKLKTTEEEQILLCDRELSEKTAEEFLTEGLRNKDTGISEQWKQLYSWFYEHSKEKNKILLDAAFYRREEDNLSKAEAGAIYGNTDKFSVTRLERFASCAYAHFLSYGLRLSDRQQYSFEPIDLGNIAHQSLERFSRKADGLCSSWSELKEETLNRLSDECVEESIKAYGSTVLLSSARSLYMVTRIKRLMRRTLWALAKQLGRGDFRPSGYEFSFGSGKIDRIDTYEDDGTVYVKVTDYKTGNKEFDISLLYHGLQLQLPVYMNAAMGIEEELNGGKKVEPGGIFYYRIKDPIIERPQKAEETDKKLLEQLRPDGLVNASEKVIGHLDRGISGKSFCIPVVKNSDGSYGKASKIIGEEDFRLILSYTKEKERELKRRIALGQTAPNPYEMAGETGCDYCPYIDICRFDPELDGCGYNTIYKLSDKDAINKIRNKMEKERDKDGDKVDRRTE